ncbi:MAG: hypothetical protein IJ605_07695 [Prevotella sp.]|nr:hypothetical protein [Prevotella sp.]
MNRLQIIRELRRHRKLAEKRAFNFEQNKAAKYIVWFMSGFIIVYLMFFAVMLSLVANDGSGSVTALEMIMGISPFILLIDFLFRFMAQQTPSQIVKPYVLLPIPKSTCIDTFIGTSLFTWGNAIWFAMLIPYAIMSVVFVEGFWVTLGFLLCFYLLILANSQWYSIVRTLVTNSLAYWLVPLAVYAVVALPIIIKGFSEKGFENFFEFYANIGTAISNGSPLPYLGALALLAVLVAINRRLQMVNVMREISKTEQTRLRNVSQFAFFDRYGEIGQYLKLEIKSILRNKNPRKSFIMVTAAVLVLSLAITLTDVYDSPLMTNFWCFYNFVIYGSMQLTRVMCNEGNYIDCLMVRRENILKLLHAKYIFSTAILALPFVLMFPPVFTGKWSPLMLISYAVFTAGLQYFMLFQMAVYNKQTIPLNTKFISKGGVENNYYQVVVQMVALFLPVILICVLQVFLSETLAYSVILLIGVAFIATRRLWMRNIYNRMMRRKYMLMEGFRSSR